MRPGLGLRAGDSVVNYALVSPGGRFHEPESRDRGGSPPTLYLSERVTKADLVWVFKATVSTMRAQAAAVTPIIMNTNRLDVMRIITY